MKQKSLVMVVLILTTLFLIGCQPEPTEVLIDQDIAEELESPEVIDNVLEDAEEVDSIKETDENQITCDNDLTCTSGDRCIDGACKSLNSLFQTEGCTETCKISGVKIATSDGEDYELKSGEGSYTTAGALQWKIIPTPAYCKGTDVVVPVEIEKRSTGTSLGKQVITLQKGMESEVITHPTVSRVQFTITATEITETCS